MESIHLVSSPDSPEFNHLTRALTHSSVIGLDAEWKPIRTHQSTFPTVSLLQIACQLPGDDDDDSSVESPVFLIDLASIPLQSIYQLIRDAFVSPNILKLGFRFKQDLVYLSSTFCAHDCEPGFDRVSFVFCLLKKWLFELLHNCRSFYFIYHIAFKYDFKLQNDMLMVVLWSFMILIKELNLHNFG